MFNLKNLFTRALLALMLATGAGAALAGPTYRVTVDTADYSGTGTLDFILLGYDASAVATAMLSNFVGDFGAGSSISGDVGGNIGSGVVMGTNGAFTQFAQALNLGQAFSFDVRFELGPVGEPVSFSVGLFSDTLDQFLGEGGNLAAIALAPGQPDLVFVDSALVDVSEVPEPATMASLALGLALMGSTLRARRKG